MMFRKLVSNLAFSPALVGQLGFYAKRLRKEETTRRLGLIFTALALIVQSFAVFSPPEAANASSNSDFIKGGFDSKEEYLKNYDKNTNNIKDLFKIVGITKDDIKDAHWGTVNSQDVYSWALVPHFSLKRGEKSYKIQTSSGGTRTYYYKPLDNWDTTSWSKKHGTTYKALIGKTKDGRYFALMKACGNLLLKSKPPALKCPDGQTGKYPKCKTPKKCTYPGKSHLLASDKNCKPEPKCTIPGKTNLPATDARCKPNPVAACSSLTITKLSNTYELDGTSTAGNGATITSYVYVVKRDGKVVDTITSAAGGKLTNTATTTQTVRGAYTVTLTIKTSLGDKTSSSCTKSFTIPAPKMCPLNPKLLESSPECQPCPGDETIWIKDEQCAAALVTTKTATNMTQGDVDATTTTARAADKITYTLNLSNNGKDSTEIVPSENLRDVMEYAQVIDAGGGSFDEDTGTLTWPSVTLAGGDKQTRMFTVQILSSIPAMGAGTSDETSYDCRIDNTFGNTVSIDVDCPVQKQAVEQTVAQLPHTGPGENLLFAGIVMMVVAFFYARASQIKKEIRLIRRDLNAGTI